MAANRGGTARQIVMRPRAIRRPVFLLRCVREFAMQMSESEVRLS